MRTICSGLPVCLSGVQILPQQRPPHQHVPSPHGDIRARSNTRRGELGLSDPSNMAADHCTSSNFGTPLTHLSSTERVEGECTLDCSSSGQMRTKWPRLAVVKEMADLDRRREVLKKQHNLRNAMYLLEEYRIFREEREFLACFESKSRLQDKLECTHRSFCAKAA